MSPTIYAIIAFIVVVLIIAHFKEKKGHPTPVAIRQSLTSLIIQYGEPDDIIVVNPTRGNEASGVILVYDQQDLLIVEGEPLSKSDIKDVSFSNYAIPYTPNDYRIIITTTLPHRDVIRLPMGAGNDAEFAKEVVQQIRMAL